MNFFPGELLKDTAAQINGQRERGKWSKLKLNMAVLTKKKVNIITNIISGHYNNIVKKKKNSI